jgi:hypothetical protein
MHAKNANDLDSRRSAEFAAEMFFQNELLSRRCMPGSHYHQPDAAQHEKNGSRNEVSSDWHPLKHAPHHPGHDSQVQEYINRKYPRA